MDPDGPWIRMDMDWPRQILSSDCVHVSPIGRLEGRDHYLAVVEPMARRSVVELKILDVVATGNQAAVRFEIRTRNEVVESSDWVRIENHQIREIRSFYDNATNCETLLSADPATLNGTT